MTFKKCLLVIDVQVGMFELSRPLYQADALLENIVRLIQKARFAECPIIYVQHNGKAGSPFIKGSLGWKIHPLINPSASDVIIEKKYPDSFQETTLEQELRSMAIDHIVVCGMVTEGCIDTTIRRASSLGFTIELASDCHSTTDSNVLNADQIIRHHNEVLKIFSGVRKSKEIIFAA
jgi:nicotinamidase-related amidase